MWWSLTDMASGSICWFFQFRSNFMNLKRSFPLACSNRMMTTAVFDLRSHNTHETYLGKSKLHNCETWPDTQFLVHSPQSIGIEWFQLYNKVFFFPFPLCWKMHKFELYESNGISKVSKPELPILLREMIHYYLILSSEFRLQTE